MRRRGAAAGWVCERREHIHGCRRGARRTVPFYSKVSSIFAISRASRTARPHCRHTTEAHGAAACLHEAAEAEDGVVEAGGRQELLRAVLNVHERHLGVLVAVQDGAEDVAARERRQRGRHGDSGKEGVGVQGDHGGRAWLHRCTSQQPLPPAPPVSHRWMPMACAHWISATLPSQSTCSGQGRSVL